MGFSMDDLLQEGYMALIKAADLFDENRQVQFNTFASRVIRNELLNYCRKFYEENTILSLDNSSMEYDSASAFGVIREESIKGPGEYFDSKSTLPDFDTAEVELDMEIIREILGQMLRSNKKTYEVGAKALIYCMNDYTQAEAAKFMGLNANYVRACVKRVRQKLEENSEILKIKRTLMGA